MKNMFHIVYTKHFPFVKVERTQLFAIFFSACMTGIGAFFWETILDYIYMQQLVDRGFLCGPFLPLYFFVVFFGLLYVKTPKRTVKNYFLSAFFLSLAITTIELIVGNVCEWLWGKALWTYDGFAPLSYRYISLTISLLWGFLGALYLFFVIPLYAKVAYRIPNKGRKIGTIIFFLFFIIDLMITFILIRKHGGHYQELFFPVSATPQLTFFVIGVPLLILFLGGMFFFFQRHYSFKKKEKKEKKKSCIKNTKSL